MAAPAPSAQVESFEEIFRQPEEKKPPDRISHELAHEEGPRLPVRPQTRPRNRDGWLSWVTLYVGQFRGRQARMLFRPAIKWLAKISATRTQLTR